MAEQRIPPNAEELVRRFLEAADALDPLIAQDANSASVEWWVRLEQVCERMSTAAHLIAVALAEHEAARG